MEEKTIFARQENTDALFEKILNDPWACEKLLQTFSEYVECNDNIKDPITPEGFARILFNSYRNRDLSAFLIGICQNSVFDLLRNSDIIPYRFNADGKHDPEIMTDENGELLEAYREKVSSKKYRHFLEIYNEMQKDTKVDGVYFARAHRYRHSYSKESRNIKHDAIEEAYGILFIRLFPDTAKINKSESEVYVDIWNLMSRIQKNIVGALVFYGQGSFIKDGKNYDGMGVFVADNILSVNFKRNARKVKAILYGKR